MLDERVAPYSTEATNTPQLTERDDTEDRATYNHEPPPIPSSSLEPNA